MAVSRLASVICLMLSLASRSAAQESPLRQAARLDEEQKCEQSERLYQAALRQGAPSPALLNNLGNHYLLCGDAEKARVYFARLLEVSPQNANANLQLARIATDRRQGALALQYLSHVSDSQPAIRILRAEALHWANRNADALIMLDEVQKEAGSDARVEYLYGITCARIGEYDRAVAAFNAVLAVHPGDFDVLFNLGRAAARAKIYDRALQALEVAIKLQPGNVDALMELAAVNVARSDHARAVYLLVQAKQLAPNRPEILLALARAAQSGEYYGDAAIAYDEYLRLKPADNDARRDLALVCGFTDARKSEGLEGLRQYIRKHPNDSIGHYDVAQLIWRDHPQEAIDALMTALRLDPKFAAAHVDLGWLLNRQGKTSDALPHFQKAVEINPQDARALDQLGAAYISLDRPSDAEKALRRAATVAPGDPEIMMHLGRALMESGHEEEGREILAKFQKAHPARVRGAWTQPVMIEAASLPPQERSRREIERLQHEAAAHADDPELLSHLAGLLLLAGRVEEAETQYRLLLTRNAETRIWDEGGRLLLGAERYGLARDFLERAAAANPEANLDLATAVFFLDGPAKALSVLERMPGQQNSGDYYVLKAKLHDAAGQAAEAEIALDQALKSSMPRPQIAKEEAVLLIQHRRTGQVLEFLARAGTNNPDLLLIRAVALALADQNSAAVQALKDIESRWPEWDRPYVAHGLLLEKTQPGMAKQKIETAIALGAKDSAALCALSRLASASSPDPPCSCAGGIRQMLFPTCSQP